MISELQNLYADYPHGYPQHGRKSEKLFRVMRLKKLLDELHEFRLLKMYPADKVTANLQGS